jgi:hypothetical protein
MPVYIVCHKKRNNPRVDVRICEMKCPVKEECREFASRRNISDDKEGAGAESGSVRLEAA